MNEPEQVAKKQLAAERFLKRLKFRWPFMTNEAKAMFIARVLLMEKRSQQQNLEVEVKDVTSK